MSVNNINTSFPNIKIFDAIFELWSLANSETISGKVVNELPVSYRRRLFAEHISDFIFSKNGLVGLTGFMLSRAKNELDAFGGTIDEDVLDKLIQDEGKFPALLWINNLAEQGKQYSHTLDMYFSALYPTVTRVEDVEGYENWRSMFVEHPFIQNYIIPLRDKARGPNNYVAYDESTSAKRSVVLADAYSERLGYLFMALASGVSIDPENKSQRSNLTDIWFELFDNITSLYVEAIEQRAR